MTRLGLPSSTRPLPRPPEVARLSTSLKAVNSAMLADLARSGLTQRDMYVEPSLTDLRGNSRPGYFLRYPDPLTGKPNGFCRFRYLPELFSGFAKVAPGNKYTQPAGECHAYFPRGINWPELRADPSQALYVTEGEKKAAAGCKAGYPTVGLGGVDCYKIKGRDELLAELKAFEWKARRVYLIYDSDAESNSQVQNAADRCAGLLSDHGARVFTVVLPPQTSGEKVGLDDYLLSNGKERFDALILEAEEWQAAKRILRSELLHRAVRKAERILSSRPEHKLFLHGTELVRVVEQEQAISDGALRREQGSNYLAPIRAENVELLLSASDCVFQKVIVDKETGESKILPADPKTAWCKQVLANVVAFPERLPWKRLLIVANTPVLLADGVIVDTPGYHAQTRVWFDPRGHRFPDVPTKPNETQARAALDSFAAVYENFPFAVKGKQSLLESDSYAAVLATILSILIRHLLPTVPMLGITAPEAGSGKTKIAESIAAATTGFLPTRISFDGQEEFEKLLPAALRAGERTLLIDNVTRVLNSPKLAQVLSTDEPTDFRVLGESRTVKTPNRSVILATGNALIISSDLPRRALLCRLNPNEEQPESRVFAFDPVAQARELFPRLAAAGLTALRYYLQAACPQPQYKEVPAESGSFEDWNRIVRGLLMHLGFGDPLATQSEVRNDDSGRQADIALLESLHRTFTGEFTTAQIRGCTGADAHRILCDQEGRWNPVRAGLHLARLRDRKLAGLQLSHEKYVHGTAQFRIKCSRGKDCEICPKS